MLATGHRSGGHRVGVAAVLDKGRGDHPFLSALRDTDVDVYPLPLPARAYRRERRLLAEMIRRFRPDVVHTHGYRADVLASGVARRAGVPTVTTVHGFTGGGWKNRLYERLQTLAFRRFGAVVAVSAPLHQQLQRAGVRPDRLILLPNAWMQQGRALERRAAREVLGVGENRVAVGWVGRMSHEKGLDVILDALPHLADLPVDLHLIGDGRERRELEARAALSCPSRTHWHGQMVDAGRVFAAFDVFVLSSRTEGTPLVLFEAMAAGTPIVATRVGGVPDVVSPSEAALVNPEDPEALAGAIRAVLTNPEAAQARTAAARRRLTEAFAPEPWLVRYESVYTQVRASRHPVAF